MSTRSDPESIVRALAAISPDRIVRTGKTPTGPWARCILCDGNGYHELSCPWFQAFCWEWGMSVEAGDRLVRSLVVDDD